MSLENFLLPFPFKATYTLGFVGPILANSFCLSINKSQLKRLYKAVRSLISLYYSFLFAKKFSKVLQ